MPLSTGLPTLPGDVPSLHLFLSLLRGLRLVRAVSRQALLYETVQPLRVDPRGSSDRRHTELSHHPEHLRR